ncbi:FtsQ-type POTRA domain-containing protein [Nostoc sp. FACHB-87]|uniref:cell division protein FtsQ/DivIB n=1 Tax=Nostocales TaxID=1161 RepID=UPI00168260BC|nr:MULTISPECIES: FtsQ-type POTRA domain-containing protein [Nostocales]MBD2297562.1 FtsQ-type POTRA domain-containing protein [Nostoc sp. FACHB-190]MBD2452602.1 FtsQ-type POTRA domain-containing protein [Nostoc sp. FACHB-87]MBD2473533.1 FtsQ-type POTRA domain-containing protein [Anabaena sp. FACHB-83]MBD2486198.1 FtsQ-type POTRA domain-containing protein [Aulosira sp. FACHB-615]
MAGIVSVSQTDLSQRRKKLRRQRQMKVIQAIWRTLAISGLAGGLLWVALQPVWVLRDPKQIVIKTGNQVLPETAIKSMLKLSYPQSLWKVEPGAIADSLKKQSTIAQATVTRRLLPPGLIIEIQERVPVAVAQRPTPNNQPKNKQSSTGLLDANGVWIPLEKYTLVNPKLKLPSLKVIGTPEQYQQSWSQLYPLLSQSSVKIMEVNFQDLANLILKTEIGNVHLGTPSSLLPAQIKILSQLRNLPAKINPSQIEYIDLKNPDSPIVHMIQKTPKADSQIP